VYIKTTSFESHSLRSGDLQTHALVRFQKERRKRHQRRTASNRSHELSSSSPVFASRGEQTATKESEPEFCFIPLINKNLPHIRACEVFWTQSQTTTFPISTKPALTLPHNRLVCRFSVFSSRAEQAHVYFKDSFFAEKKHARPCYSTLKDRQRQTEHDSVHYCVSDAWDEPHCVGSKPALTLPHRLLRFHFRYVLFAQNKHMSIYRIFFAENKHIALMTSSFEKQTSTDRTWEDEPLILIAWKEPHCIQSLRALLHIKCFLTNLYNRVGFGTRRSIDSLCCCFFGM
jgi:hypothetical protein